VIVATERRGARVLPLHAIERRVQVTVGEVNARVVEYYALDVEPVRAVHVRIEAVTVVAGAVRDGRRAGEAISLAGVSFGAIDGDSAVIVLEEDVIDVYRPGVLLGLDTTVEALKVHIGHHDPVATALAGFTADLHTDLLRAAGAVDGATLDAPSLLQI